MKKLAVLGASGHGKVVADCAELCGWESVVFFDDAWPGRQENGHWPVIGNTESLLSSLADYDGVVVAIGHCRTRQNKLTQLREAGAPIPTLIHPNAVISRYATLGAGSVVFAGVVVNVDARIGEGCILNTGCTIDHDCLLGDAVHVSPGANLAGGSTVGDRSWVGIGSAVRQYLHIGSDVMVGVGAAVVKDIPDGLTVVGVPAVELTKKV
jgi:sugar O-acyltransferase (sialic acid O-acetyltransferase NeuD family)